MRKVFLLVFFVSLVKACISDYQLESLVGWTIVETKTIEGFKEPGQLTNDFDCILFTKNKNWSIIHS